MTDTTSTIPIMTSDLTMGPAMDSMMAPILNSMMDTEWTDATMYTGWTAENFPPTSLGDLENTLDASFTTPLAQMTLGGLTQDDFNEAMRKSGAVLPKDTSPISAYASLDGDRSDARFLLPLERYRSFSTDPKEGAKERRRTQNRNAQRAYRLRKEQIIKDHENEIEALRSQIAKERKLNQALARVIEFLKQRLGDQVGYGAGAAPDPGLGHGNSPSRGEDPSCAVAVPSRMDADALRVSAELPKLERTNRMYRGSF